MEEDLDSSNENRRADQPSSGSKRSSNRIARHRATLACDTCRSRRTKCDGGKPKCQFCDEHDILCNYRHIPPAGPSKHDAEISAIRERLDHISSLLSVRIFDSNSNALVGGLQPPFGGYPMDESIISRNWRDEFPFMTVQTPSTMLLVRLDPTLAAQLVTMERTDIASLSPPVKAGNFIFQYEPAISAFKVFCDSIHHWYPVLHPEFFDLYHERIIENLPPSSDSCLVLLVAAVGSVAQCSSITTALEEQLDARYIQGALSMLPNVHFEFGLRSVQCFILLSIYYKCLARPCQAHDYALMASWKAQALFKCHFYKENSQELELLRRSFWSVLLIESELAYHIDMAESNIWKFDDRILLPAIHTLWHPISISQRITLNLMQLSSPHTPDAAHAIPQDAAKAYFLAEIAMCRMLRRCTTSVTLSLDQEVYAPVIAAELTHQLERWFEHLPSSIRFERRAGVLALDGSSSASLLGLGGSLSIGGDGGSRLSGLATITLYLQTQFYACLASIYWPAVYGVIRSSLSTPSLLEDCARFYDSYANFVISAAAVIPYCPINAWYLYASLFIISMTAFEGTRTPNLRGIITPQIIRCFAIAVETFDAGDAVAGSPSLRTLRVLLRERIGGDS